MRVLLLSDSTLVSTFHFVQFIMAVVYGGMPPEVNLTADEILNSRLMMPAPRSRRYRTYSIWRQWSVALQILARRGRRAIELLKEDVDRQDGPTWIIACDPHGSLRNIHAADTGDPDLPLWQGILDADCRVALDLGHGDTHSITVRGLPEDVQHDALGKRIWYELRLEAGSGLGRLYGVFWRLVDVRNRRF